MIDFLVSALGIIGLLFAVIVIFNLMIIVHEWGHFLAARWRGLKIDKFQIWFGKPIWKKTYNGVQYGLGTIPMGGFVALPQMAPMEMIEGSTDSSGAKLPPIKPLDKIIVAFAGPLFSFLLAVVFSLIVWAIGRPMQDSSTEVAWLVPGKPAEAAGFQVGDKILEVNGKKVDRFWGMIDTVNVEIVFSEGETIHFVVERDGKRVEIESGYYIEETSALERKAFRKVGMLNAAQLKLVNVLPGSPAELAGFKAGDEITHMDGKKVLNALAIESMAKELEGKEVSLTVIRDGETLEVPITAVKPLNGKQARFGFGQWQNQAQVKLVHLNPLEQITMSARTISRTLGGLFSPKSDVSLSHLSGVVGIGRIYYQSLLNPEWGLPMVFWFSVLLNVNLALLNLLPLPVLDGGHITLATIEAMHGKPMNFKFLEYVQAGFAIMLIGFMIFITWHDSRDVVRDSIKSEPLEFPAVEKVEPPPDAAPAPAN